MERTADNNNIITVTPSRKRYTVEIAGETFKTQKWDENTSLNKGPHKPHGPPHTSHDTHISSVGYYWFISSVLRVVSLPLVVPTLPIVRM